MDRRSAAVFYLDVKYGSNKGTIRAADETTMIGAKSGHHVSKSGRRYAMARVVDEYIGAGNGVKTFDLEYDALINFENVKIEEIDDIGTADEVRVLLGKGTAETGVITGDNANGTVTAAGGGSVTITGRGDSDVTPIYITYDYQYDLVTNDDGDVIGVPEVNVSVSESMVEAIDFPLRAKYSIGAQIDLMKAHGMLVPSHSNVCRKAA